MSARPVTAVAVVVPARDEEELLPGCLEAVSLAAQRICLPVVVVVVLDRCHDRTADVVAARPELIAVECDAGVVGTARAMGVSAALRHLHQHDLDGVWIACTDADSRVPVDWLEHQLKLADDGVDLVLGTVDLAGDELPPATAARWWRDYNRLVDEAAHAHVHGANVGVRASVYVAAGGVRAGLGPRGRAAHARGRAAAGGHGGALGRRAGGHERPPARSRAGGRVGRPAASGRLRSGEHRLSAAPPCDNDRMRMVATDLDGTIVGPDGSISARTVQALQACQDAGVRVVYVTGRPPRWMGEVVSQTGHRGTALCGNGAVVYDLAAEQVLHARVLTTDVVLEVARRLTEALPDATFALETVTGLRRTSSYVVRWDVGVEAVVGDLPSLLADDPGVVKLLCRSESSLSDDMLARAIPVLDGLAAPTHSNPNDGLLEISALGVGKASALAELAREWGIDQADVVAFGDMPNDLDMIGWAGRGFAMRGGHADVLAVAHDVAPPVTEDGVAQVLERLLATLP
ncbi:HAD-IIB family hydrolase [Angustibacter sp. Root456]|uniref:HAD-IIB family hydrolase n=1 Tax=Angustibacter sp. Root456 TaxID=1736539 RepID=UPI000701B8CF|nr:HAD-IIB family hydrolase [Angustibacter sp. Root456]KQX61773.1 hypothetical protein ASD06_14430 [Angustibacter sp. Root456]